MTYTQPLIFLFLAIGFVGLWRRSWRLVAMALGGIFLVAWPPVDWLVSRPLEAWYLREAFPGGEAEAIVVLSAGADPAEPERPNPLPDQDTYARCRHAAWLFKNWRTLPVLACGGLAGENRGQAFSTTMSRLLQTEGVPAATIWTEERSRSTHENAAFGAEILRRNGIRRIALVTGAREMLRAERSFRKQGLTVVPAPCGFRRLRFNLAGLLPGWRAIYRNESVLHESVGLVWYWMRGWI